MRVYLVGCYVKFLVFFYVPSFKSSEIVTHK